MPLDAAATDEAILGISDEPYSAVSEESSTTVSTTDVSESSEPTEQTEEETQPGQPESIAGKSQQPTQQTAKPGTPTPEQAQEVIAQKAAQLNKADAAFASGDVQGMAETFEQMFGENPAGLTEAMWMGFRFLEQRSPEQFASFSKMVLADQLAQVGIQWSTLEKIGKYLEQANDRETFEDLNRLAVLFKQIGIGPQTRDSQSAAFSGYTKQIGSMLDRAVPSLIRASFGERFSSVPSHIQRELLEAVRLDVRDMLAKDPKLGAAFVKLSKSYSDREGVRVYLEELAPRLRSVLPMVVSKVANENRELFKNIPASPKPARPAQPATPAIAAPRSHAEAASRGMSMADILRATESEFENGSFLTQQDADSMSDMDILSSRRIPQPKKPWKPESVFDE